MFLFHCKEERIKQKTIGAEYNSDMEAHSTATPQKPKYIYWYASIYTSGNYVKCLADILSKWTIKFCVLRINNCLPATSVKSEELKRLASGTAWWQSGFISNWVVGLTEIRSFSVSKSTIRTTKPLYDHVDGKTEWRRFKMTYQYLSVYSKKVFKINYYLRGVLDKLSYIQALRDQERMSPLANNIQVRLSYKTISDTLKILLRSNWSTTKNKVSMAQQQTSQIS